MIKTSFQNTVQTSIEKRRLYWKSHFKEKLSSIFHHILIKKLVSFGLFLKKLSEYLLQKVKFASIYVFVIKVLILRIVRKVFQETSSINSVKLSFFFFY